jgi:hypothetical protein
MSLYVIAIGGTGAKFVEALTHVAAAGLLGKNPVKILFVDPDAANGHITRAVNTINLYRDCYRLVHNPEDRKAKAECPWLQSSLNLFSPNLWSPVGESINRNLNSLFNYSNYAEGSEMRNLFDALYTLGEREMDLEVGFRGRPAIGSAVMSQVANLDQPPWPEFFAQVKKDLSVSQTKDVRIFLCGSAFGGTGAAGFPTLARMIANRLQDKDLNCRESVKLGGALLLPYFDFPVPQNSEEIFARPQDFLLNTEAALRYYRDQAQTTFDIIYLLGCPELAPVEEFNLGKGKQCNPPHFLEIYAALAVKNFLELQPSGSEDSSRGKAAIISRNNSQQITWEDFPPDFQQPLKKTTRFAVALLTDLRKTLEQGETNFTQFSRLTPWGREFFDSAEELKKQREDLRTLTRWCDNYLTWLGNLHLSAGNSTEVNLFDCDTFYDRENQVIKDVSVHLGELMREQNKNDTIAQIKSQKLSAKILKTKPNTGVVGLARALYINC